MKQSKKHDVNFFEQVMLLLRQPDLILRSCVQDLARISTIRHTALLAIAIIFFSKIIDAQNNTFPALIPLPVEIKQTGDQFQLNSSTRITCSDSSLFKNAALLNLYISNVTGQSLRLSTLLSRENFISLQIDPLIVAHSEGYQLLVQNNHIEITAHDTGGIIYGIETLRQLWNAQKNNTLTIAGCFISDYPRFAYRGMALDVGRHLFPTAFIKKYIDLLALYKFNTFHWHLTEDQGWRVEIKQYPKLQSVAARRNETLIGHKKELPHRYDGKKYGGYYKQEEIKEIVQYAAQRNISIIPEIEMPGHALAALSAYPSLGCTGGPYKAATFWGIFDDVYCAGNDSTFVFLQNVLDEVMELFPSKYIHIGGDECPKTRWKVCPKCQRRMKELNLKDEHALQSYFIQRIEKYINNKGRNIIGWDEILEGGLAPNATVMSWRGEEGGIAAAQQKHNVVMTPESHLYFDYYQSLYTEEPLAAGGYTPLNKVYSYEPAGDKVSTDVKQYINGIEGQAWSEYYTDAAQAEYMIFPRALALAEIAWTPSSLRDYPGFLQRLRSQQKLLQQVGVHPANNFDEIQLAPATVEKGNITVSLQSSLPGSQIYYTTNGNRPSSQSLLYTSPLVIQKSCIVKAQLYNERKQPTGRIFQQQFFIHKAIGAVVSLKDKPVARFNTDPGALVNGFTGNNRYNNGQWLGFNTDSMEAVIDLGAVKTIQNIQMNFLNYHWQRMWAPVLLEVFISTDSVNFEKVYTQTQFPVNGVNAINAAIKSSAVKYVKVVAQNKGIIPKGEYGAGNKALLMIDEIIIN